MQKVIYSGIFFEKLPECIKADYENTPRFIHITHKFRPSREQLNDELVGKKITVEVLGIGNNNRNQALLTRDDVLGYNHITVSWKYGSTPKESKNIKEWTKFENPIKIVGTYGYFNGRGILTKLGVKS